jgi:hypothetical protein
VFPICFPAEATPAPSAPVADVATPPNPPLLDPLHVVQVVGALVLVAGVVVGVAVVGRVAGLRLAPLGVLAERVLGAVV